MSEERRIVGEDKHPCVRLCQQNRSSEFASPEARLKQKVGTFQCRPFLFYVPNSA